jgi:hypothetical protein
VNGYQPVFFFETGFLRIATARCRSHGERIPKNPFSKKKTGWSARGVRGLRGIAWLGSLVPLCYPPSWTDRGSTLMLNIFHYTDRDGWNAIRSQSVWRFKASQPNDPDRPAGCYFTDIPPTPANLRTLHK